jgi:hypothetical protein
VSPPYDHVVVLISQEHIIALIAQERVGTGCADTGIVTGADGEEVGLRRSVDELVAAEHHGVDAEHIIRPSPLSAPTGIDMACISLTLTSPAGAAGASSSDVKSLRWRAMSVGNTVSPIVSAVLKLVTPTRGDNLIADLSRALVWD